ncbi:MAG: hypothetical protein QM780_10795 [Hyphomicrobium sp.]|uniref:hypothetical protein n=1 Tax=Hyphomicrobium sp. TaxID=82 RepID=UPI0039E2D22E
MPHSASALVIGIAILLVGAPDGHAASFCEASVKSGVASGKTEDEAKAAATAWWSSRAGSLGEGYQDWARAKDKDLNCHLATDGGFKCTASGKPCLPDGKLPPDPNKKDL